MTTIPHGESITPERPAEPTPGSWRAVKNDHSEGWRIEAEIDLGGAPRLGVIGYFQSQVCHDTYIGTAGAEANATLAAAAPDLLTALEAEHEALGCQDEAAPEPCETCALIAAVKGGPS